MQKKVLIPIISLILVLFSTNLTFSASSSPKFSFQGAYPESLPVYATTYFQYQAAPGSEIRDGIQVFNLDKERTISVKLAFESNKKRQGYIPNEWILIDKNEITLQPLESKTINFRIQIPEKAKKENLRGKFILNLEKSRINEISEASNNLNSTNEENKNNTGLKVNFAVAQDLKIEMETLEKPKLINRIYRSKASNLSKENGFFDLILENFETLTLILLSLFIISIAILPSEKINNKR